MWPNGRTEICPPYAGQAFFRAVGTVKTEGYDKLHDLLPTLKESSAHAADGTTPQSAGLIRLVQPHGRQGQQQQQQQNGGLIIEGVENGLAHAMEAQDARQSRLTFVHPMRQEWLDAADEVGERCGFET